MKFLLVVSMALLAEGINLFSQVSANWRTVGNLSVARTRHESQYMGYGNILVFGGSTPQGVTNTAEIVNIYKNTIISTASMKSPRAEFCSLMTPDSSILAIGGLIDGGNNVTASIEAFNTKTNTWSDFGALVFPRRQFTAIWISRTEFLVVGGRQFAQATVNSAEIFNITTKQSRQIPDYPVYTNNPVSGYSSQEIPIVFGGREGGTGSNQSDDIHYFDTNQNTWTVVGKMTTFSEYPPILRLWNNQLAYTGGNNEQSRNTDWLNDIALEENNTFRLLGRMKIGRHTHFLAQWDATTLLTGGGLNGEPFGNQPLKSTEWIDITTGKVSPGPDLNFTHAQSTFLTIPIYRSGKPFASKIVVISGFSDNFQLTPVVEILEPSIQYEPPILSSGSGDCHSYTFDVSDSEQVTSIQLDIANSDNVDISFSPSLPSTSARVTIMLRDIGKQGKFNVVVINSRGISATKNGSLSGGSVLELQTDNSVVIRDTIIIGQMRCRTVYAVNPGTESISISQIYMIRNVEISLPGGSGTLTIPPKGKVPVTICYAPQYSDKFDDTLIISNQCTLLQQPFSIIAIPYLLYGYERCLIGVNAEVYSRLMQTPPYPNPAHSFISFTSSFNLNVVITDIYGNSTATSIENDASLQSGTYIIHTENLQSGWYFINIRSGGKYEQHPVFVMH